MALPGCDDRAALQLEAGWLRGERRLACEQRALAAKMMCRSTATPIREARAVRSPKTMKSKRFSIVTLLVLASCGGDPEKASRPQKTAESGIVVAKSLAGTWTRT